jgi:hypothetical protein
MIIDKKTDRSMALVWLDEHGVPTGLPASYFAECEGDKEYVLSLFNENRSFQLLGDFEDSKVAQAAVMAKIELMAQRIPAEAPISWG